MVRNMKRKYDFFLKDILEKLSEIKFFVGHMTFEDFIDDKRTQYAVVRCLEIIGEAVSQIPDDFKRKHNSISWKNIRAFRNVVVHKYWSIDLEIVWDIIENYIDDLHAEMNKIVNIVQDD
ncbi:MAG: DUF86 domain-containing protein [Candidatus Woesearchaeota archaeon]